MKLKPSAKHLTAADIVLCVIVAAISVSVPIFRKAYLTHGESVSVSCGGERTVYPISENRVINVESNGEKLKIVIDSRAVYVEESTCRDGICMKAGRISRPGDSLICVPAGVSITVNGETEADYAFG